MDTQHFQQLLTLVTPLIQKHNTNMRWMAYSDAKVFSLRWVIKNSWMSISIRSTKFMTFINDDGQQLMHSYNVIIGRLIANNGKEFKVMMIIVYCACFAHYSCLSIFTYSWEEGYNFWVSVCNVCYVLIAFCLSVRINVFDSLFFFFFLASLFFF